MLGPGTELAERLMRPNALNSGGPWRGQGGTPPAAAPALSCRQPVARCPLAPPLQTP